MKLEIIDKDRCKSVNRTWILVRRSELGRDYHAVLYSSHDVQHFGKEIDVPMDKTISWEPSGFSDVDVKEIRHNSSLLGGYAINSVLKFGLYSGFEVGIVYAFDISYVSWLIENVDDFCLQDLDVLEKIGVFRQANRILPSRMYGSPTADRLMSEFRTIQELVSRFKILNTEIMLSDEVRELNRLKLQQCV
jgi:hypothetical protein